MFNAFLVENRIFFVLDSCNTFFVAIDFFYVRSQFRIWANMSLCNFLYLIALSNACPFLSHHLLFSVFHLHKLISYVNCCFSLKNLKCFKRYFFILWPNFLIQSQVSFSFPFPVNLFRSSHVLGMVVVL